MRKVWPCCYLCLACCNWYSNNNLVDITTNSRCSDQIECQSKTKIIWTLSWGRFRLWWRHYGNLHQKFRGGFQIRYVEWCRERGVKMLEIWWYVYDPKIKTLKTMGNVRRNLYKVTLNWAECLHFHLNKVHLRIL